MNKEEIAKSIDEGLKILKQEPNFVFNLVIWNTFQKF